MTEVNALDDAEQDEPAVGSYGLGEEIANSVSHGIGAGLGIAGLILMILVAEGTAQLASAIIYGVSIILLFLASTLYHAIPNKTCRKVMKILDHCAIYILIAGTYTPYMLVSLANDGGWLYCTSIWIIALAGVLFKSLLGHRYPRASLISYLAMGWFVVAMAEKMMVNVPVNGLILLVAGGLSYTVGAVFYAWKKLVYNHAIWHMFVLAGAGCHFFSIYWYVLVPQ